MSDKRGQWQAKIASPHPQRVWQSAEFGLADARRPFLISAPPYGGGGYVKLTATANAIIGFELSFMFGAVVAIKFGPLSAQGRVTAGIFFKTEKPPNRPEVRVLAAFVEAVGEGSIACFYICVFIRVSLIQEGSRLSGQTEFRLTFKVGFVEFSYGFTATYTLSNSGSESLAANWRPQALSASAGTPLAEANDMMPCPPVGTNRPRYYNGAPRKATQWDTYKQRLAMSLLKES